MTKLILTFKLFLIRIKSKASSDRERQYDNRLTIRASKSKVGNFL